MAPAAKSPAFLSGMLLLLARWVFAVSVGTLESMPTPRQLQLLAPESLAPQPSLSEIRPPEAPHSSRYPASCEPSAVLIGRKSVRI